MEYLFYLMPIVFFAGIVRGYSGFGFAIIAVIGLNLFLSPAESVPIVLGLDFICSISLFKQAVREAHMNTFYTLVTGAIIGIPIGLIAIIFIPALWLKLTICVLVLLLSLILFRKPKPSKFKDSPSRKLITGIASGAGISSASIGGPMVLFYILSSSLDIRAQRATMILFFIVGDFIALFALAISQPSTDTTFTYLGWLILPTLFGIKLGQYFFNIRPPKSFKTLSLPLIIIISIIGIISRP